jgi:hypothetical protein
MAVDVRPVTSRRDVDIFVRLPWLLYRDHPSWMAALIFERKRNPFFKHAEAEYFLAFRDGRAVGRISAHVDHNFLISRRGPRHVLPERKATDQ